MPSLSRNSYNQTPKPDPHPGASGFLSSRILHLHPTRRCNLACSHCYSSSSPQQDSGVNSSLWRQVLPLLRSEGYEQVSLSGGEPLLYEGLPILVSAAADEGFRLTLISNGVLISKPTVQNSKLLKKLDGVAISFDGLAYKHDEIRGRHGVFQHACNAIKVLLDLGLPVAAAISVTNDSIEELPDLVYYLATLGVTAVQIRPVASAGRASQMTHSLISSVGDQLRLYLVVKALAAELSTHVTVHGDLAPARALFNQRHLYGNLLSYSTTIGHSMPILLSDLVNPLVITDTALLKPVAFDMHSSFDIGSMEELKSPLFFESYRRLGAFKLKELIHEALQLIAASTGVVDWYDNIARLSHKPFSHDHLYS